jgi:hypothetical protein
MSGRVISHTIASIINIATIAKMSFRIKHALAFIFLGVFKKVIGNVGAICQNQN